MSEDPKTTSRRTALKIAAGVGIASGLPMVFPSAAFALSGWPSFTRKGEAFSRENLDYNPTDELVFPCIRLMEGKIPNPLGRWYLYYSPHDPPGGICVAYGDSLDGPFTEYQGNPMISNVWSPYYSVSHVASPHVLWNEANSTFYMYFHGENNTTRLARSTDGLNWTYDRVVVSTAQLPSNVTETSYARVFRHTIPSKNNIYVMMFMGNQAGTRKIFLAWSNDQRSWTVQQSALVSPAGDGQPQISNPFLVLKDGVPHVMYNSAVGMHVTRVGVNFDQEQHLGIFYTPSAGFPDNGRAAAPSFAEENGVVHMYYEAGRRLDGRIAMASAPRVSGVSFRS